MPKYVVLLDGSEELPHIILRRREDSRENGARGFTYVRQGASFRDLTDANTYIEALEARS